MPVFSIDRSIIYVIRNILCFIDNIILLFLANNDNLICIVLIIVLLIYSTGRIKKMYEEKKNMKTLSPDECLEDAELLKALGGDCSTTPIYWLSTFSKPLGKEI